MTNCHREVARRDCSAIAAPRDKVADLAELPIRRRSRAGVAVGKKRIDPDQIPPGILWAFNSARGKLAASEALTVTRGTVHACTKCLGERHRG